MIDGRVATSFRTHPKRVKLQRRLGAEGVLAFVDLILFAVQSRPSGVLTGMTEEDIAIAAQWTSDPEKLTAVLVETGLLDRSESGDFSMHDWTDHNPYAANAPSRSLASARAAHKRWLKERGISCNKRGCELCGPHSNRMRAASKGNAPVPSPTPPPPPTPAPTQETIVGFEGGLSEPAFSPEKEFEALWNDYPLKDGTREAKKHFLATVTARSDLTECKTALSNYKKHLEKNPWKRPKNGSTWFNNWRDWVNWTEETQGDGNRKHSVFDDYA